MKPLTSLMLAEKHIAKQHLVISTLHYALMRISKYQSPERLKRDSQKDWGLDYEEALEGAYENVLQEAKSALRGVRIPKVAPVILLCLLCASAWGCGKTSSNVQSVPPCSYDGVSSGDTAFKKAFDDAKSGKTDCPNGGENGLPPSSPHNRIPRCTTPEQSDCWVGNAEPQTLERPEYPVCFESTETCKHLTRIELEWEAYKKSPQGPAVLVERPACESKFGLCE